MSAAAVAGGIGITRISQTFLSLSSVLRPLSANLSNTAMSAGFAGFQFGALPVAMTLATAALATWRDWIVNWTKAAMEAGFVTQGFSTAVARLSSEWNAFKIELGVISQEAFTPLFNTLADFLSSIDTSKLESAVNLTARILEIVLDFSIGVANRASAIAEFFGFTGSRGRGDRRTGSRLALRQGRGSIGEIADAGSNIQKQILQQTDKELIELIKQTRALERIAGREEEISNNARNASVPARIGP